ncbi:MAG: MFS transporter [Nostocoides sp.]
MTALFTMAATAVTQGFARFAYSFVLPAMTKDVLGSYSVAGLLGAANLGAYLLAVLVMTVRPPRVEPTLLVKSGLVISTSGFVLIATGSRLWMLFLGITLLGASTAIVWLPCSAILAQRAPVQRRGLAYGLMIMGVGVSIWLTGVLTNMTRQRYGDDTWRPLWMVIAGISVGTFMSVAIGLRPIGRATPAPIRGFFRGSSHFRTARLAMGYGLYGAGFSVYVHYLAAALQNEGGLDQSAANATYALLGIASMFGSVLIGRISDRLHRAHVLSVAVGATGLCAMLLILVRGQAAATIGVLVFGLCMTGIGSVQAAYISDEVEPNDVATIFGLATLSLAFAQVIAPPVGGWLVDHTGSFTITYLLSGTASLAAGAVIWTLPSTR